MIYQAASPKEVNYASLIKQLFFTCLFITFLYPFSISIAGGGASANYFFVLLPVVVFIIKGRAKLPGKNITSMIVMFVVIFFISTIYQYEFYQFVDRRIISFILFMSMFSYMFMKIDPEMVKAFKLAIVCISVYFILGSLNTYFSLGGAELGSAGKSSVGSQRYGFVYLFAFWILVLYRPRVRILNIVRLAGIFVVAAGLLLTFSRSSVVALLGGLIFYSLDPHSNGAPIRKLSSNRFYGRLILLILGFGVLALALERFLPATFDFYSQQLFSLTTGSGDPVFVLDDPDYSEGYRIYILQKILEFVSLNPFTGAGFLGVWVMFDDLSGSAHNQYTDMLFRTGVFGLAAYILLLSSLFRYLRSEHQGLFLGFFSVLIYGLFHETFKESQGGFLLAFLLGMMANARHSSLFKFAGQVRRETHMGK